jgi:hypothetical protein
MGLTRRPDQRHQPTNPVGIGVNPSNIVRARLVVVGAPGGPQVIITPGANIPVTFVSSIFGDPPPTDVSSVSNLQSVIELPSGAAGEIQPALMGTVVITYTDATVAPATLILGAALNQAFVGGSFTLLVGESTGGHNAGTIMGNYQLTGGVLKLQGTMVVATDGSIQMLNRSFGIAMATPGSNVLIPVADPWHLFGALQNGWLRVVGEAEPAYRMTAAGELEVAGTATVVVGPNTAFGTVIAGPVPAVYQPNNRQPVFFTSRGATGAASTGNAQGLALTPAGNLVVETVGGTAGDTPTIRFHAFISLDLPTH